MIITNKYKFLKLFSLVVAISALINFFLLTNRTYAADPTSTWSNTNSLPYTLANHQVETYNNMLYIFGGGGIGDVYHSNILSSVISQNSISDWQTTGSLPEEIIWFNSIRNQDHIYVLGGAKKDPDVFNTSSLSSVYMYTINNDGSLSNPLTLNSLPQPVASGGVAINKNRIYYTGGFIRIPGSPDFFVQSKTYTAEILPDGTISNWIETTPLPTTLFGHGMIDTGSKIIIIGGRTSFWYSSDKVYEAVVNPDGSLGNWIEAALLPQSVANAGIVKSGNTIFVVGGANMQGNVTNLKNVYYANINNSGSIGSWTENTNSLPKPTCCGSLTASSTHLYYTGGYNTNYTNEVWVARIQPTTNYPSLNVPDIKQYSPPWNSQIYDNAIAWSSNPTIERWGCALTSAAMVLNYYNHGIDPGSLNSWLNSQSDGYIRNGLLNWLAISRYTKLHDSPASPSLEYQRLAGDLPTLANEILQSRPPILQEPGHFVVAKSQLPTTFGINDPAYPNRTTLASYSNSLEAIGSYKPSHTDLSYIYLLVDPNINMSVFDPNDNKLEGFSFTTQPLTDDMNPSNTSGTPLNTFLFPKPSDGEYRVELTGPGGTYALDSYLYDKDGNVQMSTFKYTLSSNKPDIYQITIGENSQIEKIDFKTLLKNLDKAWNQKKIKKLQIYNLLRLEVELSQKLYEKGNIQASKTLINVLKIHLKNFSPAFIDSDTSQNLLKTVQLLESTLF